MLASFRTTRSTWRPSSRGVGACDPAAPRSLFPRDARQGRICFLGLGFRGRFSFRGSQTEALSLFMVLIRGEVARLSVPSRPPGKSVGAARAAGDSRQSRGQRRAGAGRGGQPGRSARPPPGENVVAPGKGQTATPATDSAK